MVKVSEAQDAPKGRKPDGVFRKIAKRFMKKEDPPMRDAYYNPYLCLRTLELRQREGWDDTKFDSLLRVTSQRRIYGKRGETNYFSNKPEAPVVNLALSRDPQDWPKDYARWSIAFHEKTESVFCIFVDLDRVVAGKPAPMIVKEQIAGFFGSSGWGRMEGAIREAERAVVAGEAEGRKFDFVMNDCGTISYEKLIR